MKKGQLSLVLFFTFYLLYSTESYGVEQLYRSMNITCLEEADLKRICDSQVYWGFSALNFVIFFLFRLSVLVHLLLRGLTTIVQYYISFLFLEWRAIWRAVVFATPTWSGGPMVTKFRLFNYQILFWE